MHQPDAHPYGGGSDAVPPPATYVCLPGLPTTSPRARNTNIARCTVATLTPYSSANFEYEGSTKPGG